MNRTFTGRHMAAIMISFFGVIIAVNLTMATFATRTFGGKVVENSYVASQKFNAWLAEGEAQEKLGWRHQARLDARRRVLFSVASAAGPLGAATVTGFARHPLGREKAVELHFVSDAPGSFRSEAPLPAGRWYLHLEVTHGAQQAKLIEQVG